MAFQAVPPPPTTNHHPPTPTPGYTWDMNAPTRLPDPPAAERRRRHFLCRNGPQAGRQERRRSPADRGDRQGRRPGRGAVAPQYQTVNSPVHRAVWDRGVPVELFASAPADDAARRAAGDGRFARRRPAASRRRARCSTPTARSPTPCSPSWATAGYWGLLVDRRVRRLRRAVRSVRAVPDADGDGRSDGRRPGVGPRLHRRGRSGAHLRQRRAEAALPARAGQRRAALGVRPDRAVRRLAT